MEFPGLVLISCNAGRTVSAVEYVAPPSRPSAQPSFTYMVPKKFLCRHASLACASSSLPLRSSITFVTIISMFLYSIGSSVSMPSISHPFAAAEPAISARFPSRTGTTIFSLCRRIAASRIRGSEPSVNTIRVPFPLIFSINVLIIKNPHFPCHILLYTDTLHKKRKFSQINDFTSENAG